jgi:membrane protein YdbS with pleckstrin-like domain
VATSDELTETQRVVVVVVMLAIAITLMFSMKWFLKNVLTPTQALVVSVLGLTGTTVWCIVKLIRWRNTKTALRDEKAWRRSYIEPHSINLG